MNDKKKISSTDLLMIANQLIQEHDQYINGMRAESVEEKDGVLIFKGNYFLNESGLPTEKTTSVFNVFKYLAHHLSKEFTLDN
ncbi:hypothetical protein VA7868_01364 [Vibrio aerogenes CECT 7868]|uniref:Protein YciN n=1 Tax=Vibrio aerogenes CECT 7868 TaxID=1216006 RepID=A0A1M5XWW3_9VIBR|nr:DUF2498 family protein [Vibrio aerogenes]SHI04290.1 hypothetical protein VA7868_01364 [Vibrio aerogenes CECT 7868]